MIGITTALRGFIPGFWVIGTAFVVGDCNCSYWSAIVCHDQTAFPERAASVIGVYSFGMGVGSAASAGLTAVFFESTGSYLFALSIWAVLAFVGLAAWFITMKGDIKVQQEARTVVKVKREKVTSPWKSRKAWLFLLFFGLQSSAFFSIITWLAPIALSAGMTLLQAGTLLSIMTIVQIFLNILIPLLMERFPARKFWLLFMLLSGMISLCLFWTGIHPLMWIGAFIMGIPLGGLFPAALLLPLDETNTAEETNAWTAMMQTGGFIMGGLLPLTIGLVYDWTSNHHYTFVIMLSLYIFMFVLAFFIGNKKTV